MVPVVLSGVVVVVLSGVVGVAVVELGVSVGAGALVSPAPVVPVVVPVSGEDSVEVAPWLSVRRVQLVRAVDKAAVQTRAESK